MKYFFIAGEASGDLHASGLMREIKKLDQHAEFTCMGGNLMHAEGGKIIKHYREMAFMGLWAVLRNLLKIRKNFRDCKHAIHTFKPEIVVLVDYPGFNLRIAEYIYRKKLGVPVYYYISPKVWARKASRIKKIKKYVTKVFTIFPFETDFYAKFNYQVQYVGNPTLDSIHEYLDREETPEFFKKKNYLNDKPIIAVLPGSRKQEISSCLPEILKAAAAFSGYQIVISAAPGINMDFYYRYMPDERYAVVEGQTYQILKHADVAIVNSGTATLETAIIGTPQVVVYHVALGRLVYLVKGLIIRTKYISLVNILAGKPVVKELFAHLFKAENVRQEVERILEDRMYRRKMLDSYDQIRTVLGAPGAAERAAKFMLNNYSKYAEK